jgi:F-type H+-transporting ATPase subunit gamma
VAKAREIKRRIRSIDKTRQITKTMEMVAASKLKRAQDRVVAARPFDVFMRQVITKVREGAGHAAEAFPLLRTDRLSGRAAVLVVTSNRGLAGAFNANLVRTAQESLRQLEAEGLTTELHVVGKRGATMLKYGGETIDRVVTDISDRPSYAEAEELSGSLIDAFVDGRLDGVNLVYSHFRSPVEQRPVAAPLLPLPRDQRSDTSEHERHFDPIYEFLPSPEAILSRLLPLFLKYGVYRALIESAASEHGARRTAMKNATDSADEMIKDLTRWFNRARQAQITQEIAELVGGSEALK